jgi:phosphopantetheinyl transferase
MPLVYQQNINEATRLAVWHIAEAEDFFLSRVPLQKEITHPHKRLQHLAGRFLLTEMYENFPLELIRVADTRKPFLPDEAYHFSISHCGDYAAAIVSTVNRVGVDIEVVSEKAGRLKYKFLANEELSLLDESFNKQRLSLNVNPFTVAWSVKECMFKWFGSGEVDFKQHLRIRKISYSEGQFTAHCLFQKKESVPLLIHGIIFNNNCLAWLVS